MNYDVGEKRKFWKEMSKVNWRKVESYNRIKNGNGRLAVGENEV